MSVVAVISCFNFSHFNGCLVIAHSGLNLLFLMNKDIGEKDIESLFMYLLIIHISSFVSSLFKSFAQVEETKMVV